MKIWLRIFDYDPLGYQSPLTMNGDALIERTGEFPIPRD